MEPRHTNNALLKWYIFCLLARYREIREIFVRMHFLSVARGG